MERNTEQTAEKPAPQQERIKQFECKVCIEIASEPVVTLCGHLFW